MHITDIEIPVLTVLKHALMIILCYSSVWLTYRYILYPGYRWNQRDNICYDDAMDVTKMAGTIIFIIIESLINIKITFSWMDSVICLGRMP